METKKLTIVIEPDPILHKTALPVEKITLDLLDELEQMTSIMTSLQGIGLAGPQVGLLKRIIVIDVATIAREDKVKPPSEKFLKLINPEILSFSKETCVREEGCLSLPTLFYDIKRPSSIKLKYTNTKGDEIIVDMDGLLARCVEHEIDHLDGKIILDYISPLRKHMAIRKLQKIKI